MKRNVINRVADLMLSNDDEMKTLGRTMFLENSPRESDIAILEKVINNKLNPIESRLDVLQQTIKRKQSYVGSWGTWGTSTATANVAIGALSGISLNTATYTTTI